MADAREVWKEQSENEVGTLIRHERKWENETGKKKCGKKRNEAGGRGGVSGTGLCSMARVSVSRTVCLGLLWKTAFTSVSGGGGLWRAAQSRPWAAPGACPSSPARGLRTSALCPSPPRWKRPQRLELHWCGTLTRPCWPWYHRRSGWGHRLSGWGRSRRPSTGIHSGERGDVRHSHKPQISCKMLL